MPIRRPMLRVGRIAFTLIGCRKKRASLQPLDELVLNGSYLRGSSGVVVEDNAYHEAISTCRGQVARQSACAAQAAGLASERRSLEPAGERATTCDGKGV